jgi:mono/diheme cytochrome c family protein
LRRLLIIVAGLGAAACRNDMHDQPRYEMYRESAFFADRAAVRPLPAHTVARGYLREDPGFYTGRIATDTARAGPGDVATVSGVASRQGAVTLPGAGGPQGAASFEPDLMTAIPFPVTREVLDHGQNEYQTFCQACHGPTGEGDGMIVRRGYRAPPSYHTDRLRRAPVGHFFDVMTNGWGAMPSYGYLVTPRDRWAIAAYIRALQLSRSARLDDLPPGERQKLAGQIPAQPAASPSSLPATGSSSPSPMPKPIGGARP